MRFGFAIIIILLLLTVVSLSYFIIKGRHLFIDVEKHFTRNARTEEFILSAINNIESPDSIKYYHGIIDGTESDLSKQGKRYLELLYNIEKHCDVDTLEEVKNSNPTLRILFYLLSGRRNFYTGDYSKAMEYYFEAVKIIQEDGDAKILGRIYYLISYVYVYSVRPEEANFYAEYAEKIAQESDDQDLLHDVYSLYSNIYAIKNDYSRSKFYSESVEKYYCLRKNYKQYAESLSRLADCCLFDLKDSLANVYILNAKKYAVTDISEALYLLNSGIINYYNGSDSIAESIMLSVIKSGYYSHMQSIQSTAYVYLGRLYADRDEFVLSDSCFLKAKNIYSRCDNIQSALLADDEILEQSMKYTLDERALMYRRINAQIIPIIKSDMKSRNEESKISNKINEIKIVYVVSILLIFVFAAISYKMYRLIKVKKELVRKNNAHIEKAREIGKLLTCSGEDQHSIKSNIISARNRDRSQSMQIFELLKNEIDENAVAQLAQELINK